MLVTSTMWHPAGEAKQYQAAGSRTSFNEKWNPHTAHIFKAKEPTSDALQLLIAVLTDEQKKRWRYGCQPAA